MKKKQIFEPEKKLSKRRRNQSLSAFAQRQLLVKADGIWTQMSFCNRLLSRYQKIFGSSDFNVEKSILQMCKDFAQSLQPLRFCSYLELDISVADILPWMVTDMGL